MKHIANQLTKSERPALGCILALALMVCLTLQATESQRTFATPEEAATALANAVSATNHDELGVIFGPTAKEIENPDRVQAANEFAEFSAAS